MGLTPQDFGYYWELMLNGEVYPERWLALVGLVV